MDGIVLFYDLVYRSPADVTTTTGPGGGVLLDGYPRSSSRSSRRARELLVGLDQAAQEISLRLRAELRLNASRQLVIKDTPKGARPHKVTGLHVLPPHPPPVPERV